MEVGINLTSIFPLITIIKTTNMSKVLIVNEKKLHGSAIVVPVDGEVEISKEGEVEVSDEAAQQLQSHPSFTDPDAEVVETEELDEETAAALLDGVDLDKLADLDVDSLGQIAEAAKIPNWKKFKANQKALSTYVRNQLKKQQDVNAK